MANDNLDDWLNEMGGGPAQLPEAADPSLTGAGGMAADGPDGTQERWRSVAGVVVPTVAGAFGAAGAPVILGGGTAASVLGGMTMAGGTAAMTDAMFGAPSEEALMTGALGAAGEVGGRALERPVGALARSGGQLISQGARRLSPALAGFLDRIGGRLMRPYQAELVPGARHAQGIVEQYGGEGATLGLDQIANDPLLTNLGGIARVAWFSSGRMERQQQGAIRAITHSIDDYANAVVRNMDPIQRGQFVQRALANSDDAFHGAARSMYQEVDRLYGNRPIVDLSGALQWAEGRRGELLGTLGTDAAPAIQRLENFLAPGNPNQPILGLPRPDVVTRRELTEETARGGGIKLRELSETTNRGGRMRERTLKEESVTDNGVTERNLQESIIAQAMGVPTRSPRSPIVTFEEAQKLRSALRRLQDIQGDSAAPETRRVTAELAGRIDAAMERAGTALPGSGPHGSAAEAWRAADSFYRTNSDTFNSQFLVKWANHESPSAMFDTLMKAPPEDVRRLMQAVDSYVPNLQQAGASGQTAAAAAAEARRARENIQGSVMMNLIQRASEEGAPGVRELSGQKFTSEVLRLTGTQEARLRELFPNGEHAEFFRRVHALKVAEGGAERGKIGQLAIQSRAGTASLIIAGAALGGAASAFQGGGAMGAARDATTTGLGTAIGIFLGTRALGRVMADKRAVDALIRGMQAPAGTKLAARATAQFVAELARLNVLDDPNTRLPLPAPLPPEDPPKIEGIKTGEDVLRLQIHDKVTRNQSKNIMRLWEMAAAGAPER